MRAEDIEFLDQRTFTLLIDISLLLDESESRGKDLAANCFARSAIANAGLLLECVANSCLMSLVLPSRLLDEIDRLPVLSKLDYYLFAKTGTHLDRGCREVQLVGDVLRLRDHIVHPKPKSGRYVKNGQDERVEYGFTAALDIAFDNREWTHIDGAKVARAAIQFLTLFFLDWCKLEKGDVTRVLGCREKGLLNSDQGMWIQITQRDYGMLLKWLPSLLQFMDLRTGEASA